MPELPEVEVTRLSIEPNLIGAQIVGTAWGKPLRWPLGCSPAELNGRWIQSVRRRGKYLMLELNQGWLLVHLGMSGRLAWLASGASLPPMGRHDHFQLMTQRGALRLTDPRRFGAVVYSAVLDGDPAEKLLSNLGVEPLSDEFDAQTFVQAIQRHRSAIKTLLLKGEIVVGVGNIYACESLFLSGIHPLRTGNSIPEHQLLRLRDVIVKVLAKAVEMGGSSFKDFVAADGQLGHYQTSTCVYDREGMPCRVCGTPVQRFMQSQRSTYWCPTCQPVGL